MEGPDPRPAPLTEPSDPAELPDWARVEPPDEDVPPDEDGPPEDWDASPSAIAPEVVAPAEPVVQVETLETAASVEEPPIPAVRLTRLVPAVLGLVLLALLGAFAWLVVDARDARHRDDARQTALQAARQEAVNLTTISYQTADADLGRIIANATGTLKTQFEAQRAQFPAVLERDKSVSVGTVLAAGITSQSAHTVEALVAVDAAVSNAQSGKAGGQPLIKHYRMDMKLVLVSGRWLVSQVAFAGLPQ